MHRKIEALNEATRQIGKLDKAALDRALDRILKAAQEINAKWMICLPRLAVESTV